MRTLPTGVKITERKGSLQLNNGRATRIEVESEIKTPNRLKQQTCTELLSDMFKGMADAYNGELFNN